MKIRALNELPVGAWATVDFVKGNDDMSRRLMELGLVPGTRIEGLFSGPSGDPTAYLIKGAVVALRQEDAALVSVIAETLPKERIAVRLLKRRQWA